MTAAQAAAMPGRSLLLSVLLLCRSSSIIRSTSASRTSLSGSMPENAFLYSFILMHAPPVLLADLIFPGNGSLQSGTDWFRLCQRIPQLRPGPVQPRRKQRQLNQKVRYEQSVAEEAVVAPVVEETAAAEPIVQEAPAPRTELVKVPLPVVAQTAPEQQEENNADNRDNGGMPRRSRRSPRHLRVSGQRRRRYRDERYPTQSPMPLTVACASPELASGKVWIRYPIVRPQDVQVEEQREQEEVHVQPMVTEVPVAAAIEPVVSAPVVEEVAGVVEAPVQVAEPQPEVVETTHPEVNAAAVTEQPQVITESDVAVAQEVAEHAEPVVEPQEETADIEEVAETAEVVVAEPEVVAQPAAPVVAEVAAEVETVAAVEPEITVEHNHATAPMTRAPAPEYVPEAPRHSDWQRPTFAFEGKGAAGGHTATHHASAAPARPQPVE